MIRTRWVIGLLMSGTMFVFGGCGTNAEAPSESTGRVGGAEGSGEGDPRDARSLPQAPDGASKDGGGGNSNLPPAFTDLSVGGKAVCGLGPRLMIDAEKRKLVAFANAAGMRAADGGDPSGLVHCDLDGSHCAFVPRDKLGMPTGYGADAVVDVAHHKILIVIPSGRDVYGPMLYRCDLDGTGCGAFNISVGREPLGLNFTLRAAIDEVSQKLLVAVKDGTRCAESPDLMTCPQPLGLWRCNLDGSDCVTSTISTLPSTIGGSSDLLAEILVDSANRKLLFVAERNLKPANTHTLILYRCNLDGRACTSVDIAKGQPRTTIAAYRYAAIDPVNRRLLVVASSPTAGGPRLIRCNLDGTQCSDIDISAGVSGPLTGVSMTLAVDTTNQKLLAVGRNDKAPGRPALYRCDLDGTKCQYIDLDAGQKGASGRAPAAVIDPISGKLLVGTCELGTGPALSLFSIGLSYSQ